MGMTDLHGREITDPKVHDAVLNSIRQMPFRDLVAAIEGEEAAAAMTPSSTTIPIVDSTGGISPTVLNMLPCLEPKNRRSL